MRARRCSLSVPASSERMLSKALGLAVDEVIADLEDSVTIDAKEPARELVGTFAGRADVRPFAVRINALSSPWGERDLVELVHNADGRIRSLIVPKVERPEDVLAVHGLLDELGAEGAGVGLQALIETASGLLRAGEIAAASPRLEALILGYLDLTASLGRGPGASSPESWMHAQETVLVAARAYGLQAIDGPYLEIRDDARLRVWAEHVRALGFDGKWAIHPSQVATINAVFTPSAEELARAHSILEVLAGAEGRGAVELGGEMIDEATRKRALEVIERGRAAGVGGGPS